VNRLQDEVISGGRPQELAQNRTNNLLAKFLSARYGTSNSDGWGELPPRFQSVDEWLEGFLGSPVSAADASVTPAQKEGLAKALGLNASAEATVRWHLSPLASRLPTELAQCLDLTLDWHALLWLVGGLVGWLVARFALVGSGGETFSHRRLQPHRPAGQSR
jgi:hypothetical protein